MKSLNEILKNLEINEPEIPKIQIDGLSFNSKKVKKGDLFIAIKGQKQDGNAFIDEAVKFGAAAVITDNSEINLNEVPVLRVQNCRIALSKIAAEYFDNPSKKLTIIGITGTNGKTTTAFLVKSVLENANLKVATLGTLGLIAKGQQHINTLTTPDPITLNKILNDLYLEGFSHIVMEVSSHAIDQYRIKDINFKIACFTNITPEHLDYHGTFENYKNTKAKLFQLLRKGSKAIINIDDDFGEQLIRSLPIESFSFSRKHKIGTYYKNIEFSTQGISGTISSLNEKIKIQSKLIGDFNSENILAAVAITSALNVKAKAIENGIKECPNIPGRMESFPLKNNRIAILDYAHTPDSYKKVMITLKQIIAENGHIYVVFGAGGNRDKNKRPKMARALEDYARHCFITPDNPRFEKQNIINDQIVKGFKENKYSIYNDRREGIKAAINISKKNDVIAVLGKGRETYQEVNGEKLFHSDLDIIREFTCELK